MSLATSSAGTVASQQEFDAWCKVRQGSLPQTELNYTGQRLDSTGLLFYNARYYDPQIGKFISSDTIVPSAANPQAFNRYGYAYNNPLKYTDATGHCPNCNYQHDPGQDVYGAPQVNSGLPDLDYGKIAEAAYDGGKTGYKLCGFYCGLAGAVLGAVVETAAQEGEYDAADASNLYSGDFGTDSSSWSPSYKDLVSENKKDAHHIIQDAAVRDIPGYDRNDAPAIQLDGPSNVIGTPHYYATQAQRNGEHGTYGAERKTAIEALQAAGVPDEEIADAVNRADNYFINKLGISEDTETRIPGN